MDRPDERRELYRGASAGFSRGFEIAVAPVLLGGIGWFLDQRLGLSPILTIVFVILAIGGTAAKIYYQYSAEMDSHDADGAWSRK